MKLSQRLINPVKLLLLMLIVLVLLGKTIQMTSDNVAINSNNFKVDTNGTMECTNAKINAVGGSNTGDSSGLNFKVTSNQTYEYSGMAPGFAVIRKSENNYINMEAKEVSGGGNFTSLRINGDTGEYINNSIVSGTSLSTLWYSSRGSTQVADYGIRTPQVIATTTIKSPEVIINNEGPAMYGMNNHLYRCKWTNTALQFWVDDTNVGTLSDKRLKTDIKDIDKDFIKAIKEVEMKQFKVANRNGLVSFGIMAQDLIEIFNKYNKNPFDYEIVYETKYKDNDDTIYYAINYEQFLILKTKAQELEIKELQEKDKQKDDLLQSLLDRIDKLEKGE